MPSFVLLRRQTRRPDLLCAEVDVITAPITLIAGAVAGGTSDNTRQCISGKGGCAGAVLEGALLVAGGTFGLGAMSRIAAKSADEVVDSLSVVSSVGRRPTAAVRQAADEAATDANGVLRCQACDTMMIPRSGATNSREFDHIFPLSRGGGRDIDNIWELCRTCNRQKGAQTLDEWNGYP